jgi:deoxyribonuclease V
VGYEKYYGEQKKLAAKALHQDSFGRFETLAGFDCSYYDDNVICGAVVFDACGNVLYRAYHVTKVGFPYIPGLLAYREAMPVISLYRRMHLKPDILMIDGFGEDHPRKCGIATHVGVILDVPAIGVAKSYLCGEIKGDTVYQDGSPVSKLLYGGKSKKPVYVSSGHRLSLETCTDIVKRFSNGEKMPVPAAQAHLLVTEIRKRYEKEANASFTGIRRSSSDMA